MKTCALFLSLALTLVGCPAWAEDEIVKGPDRRNEIDLRIEELDARRAEISTTGPKVGTFLGLGVGVVGAITLGLGIRGAGCEWRCGDGGSQPAMWAGVGLLAFSFVTTSISASVWAVRAHRRNAIDAELESLIDEPRPRGLKATLSRLELRSPYRDGAQFVTLGVRF